MKIHRLFQLHFRLIYLFIWGLTISGLSDLTWLISLNVLAVSLFFISLQLSQKSFLPYLKRWFALVIFIALMWATLSWQIGEMALNSIFKALN
ncbi:cobalt transport protein [Haemophilus influenzae]|uniref:Cobalt transport protein n=1 Tax=Haemophilus influenzae TaxID=727 RepID=A0A2X1Q1A0_HAEIF|nr:cobalt transport protein [Haemophilus influenzae]